MPIEKRPYNERLIEQVKALGQEVIDRAEDLVGVGSYINLRDIKWIKPVELVCIHYLQRVPTTREAQS